MSFQDAFALADTPEFQRRVTVALVKSAVAVMAEGSSAPNHQLRGTYASKVLASPEVEGMNMALGVTTNAAITENSSDSDIEFTINTLFDAYSGVGVNP
jgi:hypothetical protein